MLDNRSVSRLHALIQRREAGAFSLVDLGSRNGSFVNNRRVSVPASLNDGDILTLGDQELQFRNPGPPAGAGTEYGARDTNTRNAPTTALHLNSMATIMVVDIRDFTPLARCVSESVLSQTIGTWFLRAGQIVQRHGSWAQKYIGDAVMAVWVHGEPSNVGAEVARALRGLSEIAAATAEIPQALPLPAPLRIGAGVNTGPAVLGGGDYTALGDTVNAAFRLEEATKRLGYPVALGERSFAALPPGMQAKFARKQVELKGYEGASTVWGISFEELRGAV
jgi:adenylate cyclase